LGSNIIWPILAKKLTLMTKKIFALFVVVFAFATVHAFTSTSVTPTTTSPLATEVMVPVGKTGKFISMADLATISPKDFAALSGSKMNLLQKAGFKLSQKQLKKSINADGTINSKKLNKFLQKGEGGGFHLGGFALGFFLGLIGVLLAYVVFEDDLKKSRIKWAWIGLAAFFVLWLVLLFAVFASVT
jgi:hypothetical protein